MSFGLSSSFPYIYPIPSKPHLKSAGNASSDPQASKERSIRPIYSGGAQLSTFPFHKNALLKSTSLTRLFHSHERALLRAATRDSDDLTVNPATVLRGKEADDASDVLGSGAAAERAVLGHHLLDGSGGDVGGAAGDVCLSELVGISQRDGMSRCQHLQCHAFWVNMSLLMPPGATPLTVIPRRPKSVAKALIMPMTAILEAL